ncbi:hypothetical protein C0Q70_14042 [Pomacea canaliculata]|uniref:Homeobox domain-containing protein n=1 Tax=Pomacea canaliculata TaxID=400727 RepID=A0A2T7NYW7_POMCA|nr:hypothetical protein C0Q70_14042 [Pomacea canaliculata]
MWKLALSESCILLSIIRLMDYRDSKRGAFCTDTVHVFWPSPEQLPSEQRARGEVGTTLCVPATLLPAPHPPPSTPQLCPLCTRCSHPSTRLPRVTACQVSRLQFLDVYLLVGLLCTRGLADRVPRKPATAAQGRIVCDVYDLLPVATRLAHLQNGGRLLPRDDLRTAVNKPVYSLVPFRSPCEEDFLPPPPHLFSPPSPHFTDPHDAQLHVKMRSRHRLTSDPRHLTCAVSPDSLDTLFLAVIARFPRSEWRRWQARWPLSLLLSVGCYYHPRSALGASQKTIVSSGTEGYKPPLWARGPRAGHLRGLDGLGLAPPCASVSSAILRCLDYQLLRSRPYSVLNADTGNGGQPKRKRSWSRAVFSNLQRKGLERRFAVQKYVTKPDRRQLAAMLGLTDAQVKVWFQNRRMKWRHAQQRAKAPGQGSEGENVEDAGAGEQSSSDVTSATSADTKVGGSSGHSEKDSAAKRSSEASPDPSEKMSANGRDAANPGVTSSPTACLAGSDALARVEEDQDRVGPDSDDDDDLGHCEVEVESVSGDSEEEMDDTISPAGRHQKLVAKELLSRAPYRRQLTSSKKGRGETWSYKAGGRRYLCGRSRRTRGLPIAATDNPVCLTCYHQANPNTRVAFKDSPGHRRRGGPRPPSSGLCWESQETPRPWKFRWQLVSACRDSRLMSLHSAGFYQSNSIATAALLHELGHDFVCCIMARLTLSLTTHSQQPLQHTQQQQQQQVFVCVVHHQDPAAI